VKKEMWNQAKSFLCFESPLKFDLIDQVFSSTHDLCRRQFPTWSFSGTKRKVIYAFWSEKVLAHFAIILFLGILATTPVICRWNVVVQAYSVAGLFCFLILTLKIYWPAYFSDFLPKLDTIILERQKIELAEIEIKKCKRTQFSIPTLTIIYYVFAKTCRIPVLPANDSSAEILNTLFGSDKDKIKQNLSRLCQLSKLSPKERAEMEKGVEKARTFFDSINHSSAREILEQLDLKLHTA
jgi:hypothetical protein